MWSLARIAARNVLRNRRRSFVAVSAVILGVVALINVRGLFDGLTASTRSSVIDGHVGALQIHRAGYLKQVIGTPLNLAMEIDGALLSRIRSVPHVIGASPRLLFGGLVSANDRTTPAMFTAFDPALEYEVCRERATAATTGTVLPSGASDATVLAAHVAQRAGLAIGGRAVLLSVDRDGIFNGVEVTLVGVSGLPNVAGLEPRVGVLPLSTAQQLLRMPGLATEIAVGIDDLRHLDDVRAALSAQLGEAYEVTTWKQAAPAVWETDQQQDHAFPVIAIVFLIVALIGIMNTMLVSVLERTREIGTMLAVGMRRRRIVLLFVLEGAVLGLVGSLAGSVVGHAVVVWLHHTGIHLRAVGGGTLHVYPRVTVAYGLAVVAVCTVGALLAASYPAWKAARLRPVDAMTKV